DMVTAADGSLRYGIAGVEGDGLIVSLGGRPGFPPATAELVDRVLKRDPGAVAGEMLFDHDGQYLGYRLTVDGHVIDVTGATSRFFPGEPIFEPRLGRAYDHPAGWLDNRDVWRTDDHRYALVTRETTPADPTPQTSASRRDAPPEGGNFDGGYVATAVQVSHYAAAFGGDHITAARVPESQFHGYGRETPDPVAVEQAGSQALHQILD